MDMTAEPGDPIFCTNCGAKLGPDDRFCPECGTARPAGSPSTRMEPTPPPEFTSTFSTPATVGSFTGAPPFAGMALSPVISGEQPLLRYDVAYPDRLSRLLIFVKWLLIIPHWVVLYFFGILVSIVVFLAWFVILLTGRFPRGMWDLSLGYLRWQANVYAYLCLQRDEYPPFSGDADYPVRFELDYPPRLSRLLIFVKWLFILPSVFVFMFVAIVAFVAVFLAWFAILFTGRYPRGLFDFVTGTMRWAHRINVYYYLLTDRYPPFRMGD
jgi:hypothetical protein